MTESATPHVDVHVGDVSQSQLVFGDHNTIQTPEGTKVTVLQVGEQPVPRLRRMPLAYRPAGRIEILGRDEELRLLAAAAVGAPVQLYAPDGAGKTALLKSVAQGAGGPPEGVVFEATRRRTLDEIQAKLYTAFWECDVPFLPTPAQIGGYLADRDALVILDDCGLDRNDLDVLLDSLSRCTVVLASGDRSLWARGTARALTGLEPAAGLALLERELGHPVAAEERPAAQALVARLDASPQSLIEAAALIVDGRAALRELVDDATALARRVDPSALSDLQRRILEVLAALASAPLGVEHVSAVADAPNATEELPALERRGWVKSASPRYRLVRTAGLAQPPGEELAKRLLGHLAGWSRQARPSAVADEAEALEASLDLGAAAHTWQGALTLALAAEPKLAVSGSWTSWRRVLTSGLHAARTLGDDAAEAQLLHQLGSLSLCLGGDELAVTQLEQALGIRERLGDQAGAELTRHNLRQIGGGGPGHGGTGQNGGGGPPRLGIALAAIGVLAAAVVAVVLATSGGGGTNAVPAGATSGTPTRKTRPSTTRTTTNRTSGAPPSITIDEPKDGATFTANTAARARYTCAASTGSRIEACDGPVADGAPIDTSPGRHEFSVTARDDAGRDTTQRVQYIASNPKPTDTDPPSIDIASPDAGPYGRGSKVTADYSCTDEEGGSGVASCVGTVPSGAPIDTSTEGTHTFTVTARDNAGNQSPQTVTYTVSASD